MSKICLFHICVRRHQTVSKHTYCILDGKKPETSVSDAKVIDKKSSVERLRLKNRMLHRKLSEAIFSE